MELHLGMKTRGGLGGMINCIAIVENFHQRVFRYNLENISISSNHLADQCYLIRVILPKWLTFLMPNVEK